MRTPTSTTYRPWFEVMTPGGTTISHRVTRASMSRGIRQRCWYASTRLRSSPGLKPRLPMRKCTPLSVAPPFVVKGTPRLLMVRSRAHRERQALPMGGFSQTLSSSCYPTPLAASLTALSTSLALASSSLVMCFSAFSSALFTASSMVLSPTMRRAAVDDVPEFLHVRA